MALAATAARAFSLDIDELGALAGLLHAKGLIGLDASLFRALSEEDLPRLTAKLRADGWLTPADRPGTWHFNEDLMQALSVAVAPELCAMARDAARSRSIVFYMAGGAITEVVLTGERAVVATLGGVDAMAEQVVAFVGDARPSEIAVARVMGEAFDAIRRAKVDASGTLTAETPGLLPGDIRAWCAHNVAAFFRAAMADLALR